MPWSFWVTEGRSVTWSATKLARVTDRRLRDLLAFLWRHNTFYRERWLAAGVTPDAIRGVADLARLPLMDRAVPREHTPEMVSQGVNLRTCTLRRTTGTIGWPIEFPVTRSELLFESYTWARGYMRQGLRPWHRQAKFFYPRPQPRRTWLLQSAGLFRRALMPLSAPVTEKVAWLRQVRPYSLCANASTLDELSRHLEDTGERLCVPLVFSTADLLLPEVRVRVRDRLAASAVVNVYGAVEAGPIAWECPAQAGLHVNTNLVIVELVDEDGHPARRGRVVCTVLWRRTVPFVRYVLGDMAEWAEGSCSCGSALPRLAVLHGREQDVIRLPSGEWVSAATLTVPVNSLSVIRGYQVVQTAADRFVYYVVPGPGYGEPAAREVAANFRRRFGTGLHVAVVPVPHLERPVGAKYAPFLSLERQRRLQAASPTPAP